MTKIMRLLNTDFDCMYLVKDGNCRGLDWMTECEVINMLAKGNKRAETADVDRELLKFDSQRELFDILWADGDIEGLNKAFDELFEDCKGPL